MKPGCERRVKVTKCMATGFVYLSDEVKAQAQALRRERKGVCVQLAACIVGMMNPINARVLRDTSEVRNEGLLTWELEG